MKILLNKTKLVFQTNEVKTARVEGVGLSQQSEGVGVVNAQECGVSYFAIEKGKRYQITLTPLDGGKPVYKWGVASEIPKLGTTLTDYSSGGMTSLPTTKEIVAAADGYYVIQIYSGSATLKVTIAG